jgi:hypothetical protein
MTTFKRCPFCGKQPSVLSEAPETEGDAWTKIEMLFTDELETKNESTANNVGLVALALPVTANIGDEVEITIKGAGRWVITQNASQLIK